MTVVSSDVASTWRSPEDYARILAAHNAGTPGFGKPASNSFHNQGEAIDVHDSTGAWIRQNGAKYGWVPNDYPGTHGGHYEYHGEGSKGVTDSRTEAKGEDPIGASAKALKSVRGGSNDFFDWATKGLGGNRGDENQKADAVGTMANLGHLLTGVLSGIGAHLGLEIGSLFGWGPGTGYQDPYQKTDSGSSTPSSSGQASGAVDADSSSVSRMGYSSEMWDVYRNTLAKIESGGKYDIAGGSGGHYDGRYQMGAAAKTDAARVLGVQDPGHGAAAREAYRKNPAVQEKFFAAFTEANYNYLKRKPAFAKASKKRQMQILGYAHNQGMGGAENWMDTGQVGADGFGTKGTAYSDALSVELQGFQRGGGVSSIKGQTNLNRRMDKAMETFATNIAAASASPTIIIDDSPGPNATMNGTTNQTVPDYLPDSSSVPAATNYMFYDLTYGPVA